MTENHHTIGIASYNNPHALDTTLTALRNLTQGHWDILIIDNASPDPGVRPVIEKHLTDDRVTAIFRDTNIGYAGAVNEILRSAKGDWISYCDNDCTVQTTGWNSILQSKLELFPELGMVFPGTYVSYPIPIEGYTRILWGIGCNWMIHRDRLEDVGFFDENLGHQEEVDYQIRMMLEGFEIGCASEVRISHEATSSVNPEAQERINQGIVNWVNKWVKYFCGKNMSYYSDNVLRFEDWPPIALYLEKFWLTKVPNLNANPEIMVIDGRPYAMLKVPRWASPLTNTTEPSTLYRGRII